MRGEGLLEEGLDPLGFPGQERGAQEDPGDGTGCGSRAGPGGSAGPAGIFHTRMWVCVPPRRPGHRGQGAGGVMPMQLGLQLSSLWFSSASSHHTRHSFGSDS